MNPQTPYQAANESAVHNPLAAMQPGEQVICEIKRHPIGIIGVYVVVGFLMVLLVAAILLAPSMFGSSSRSQIISGGSLAFVVAAIISTGFLLIVNKIYWGNRWIVTDDSITQVTRTGLFHKQSSQLSLESLEDVTAEQNGLLTQIFHYGVLKAETAGEHSKFMFTYCPRPAYYAQQILNARERFEHAHSNHRDAEQQIGQPAVNSVVETNYQ